MLCCRIEPSGFDELIDFVARILRETGAHNAGRFDAGLWRWRYAALPDGDARVYGLYEEGQLKGYYHAPIYAGTIRDEAARYAVVQDVAIDPSLRGRGCFRQLADYATADLTTSDIDLVYTFPNALSIRTFLKYNGYRKVGSLFTCVLPLRPAALLAGRLPMSKSLNLPAFGIDRSLGTLLASRRGDGRIVRADFDEPGVRDVYAAFDPGARFALARTPEYLKWRFQDQPSSTHFVLAAQSEPGDPGAGTGRPGAKGTSAVAVFKLDTMFGARTLLLMDYAHRPGAEAALRDLVVESALQGEALFGQPVDLVFASGQTRWIRSLMRIGFVPIPAWANPRPLNLLARGARRQPGATLFEPDFWHITLADWDVF